MLGDNLLQPFADVLLLRGQVLFGDCLLLTLVQVKETTVAVELVPFGLRPFVELTSFLVALIRIRLEPGVDPLARRSRLAAQAEGEAMAIGSIAFPYVGPGQVCKRREEIRASITYILLSPSGCIPRTLRTQSRAACK